MITERLKQLGYDYAPANLKVLDFHVATQVGKLVFTSGQIPIHDGKEIRGKVGADVDLPTAVHAAEICAYNCLRAAGAVVDIESIAGVAKVLGMVNVAPDFDKTSEVINGCTSFLNELFGVENTHARSAIGAVLPSGWAVEVEMILYTN